MSINALAPVSGYANFSCFSTDDLFKADIMGHGIVIWPTTANIVCPFDGTYYQQNDHNIQIATSTGRWLLHIGLDFAGLTRSPVTYHFTDGATLTAGMPLAQVDWAFVAAGKLGVDQEVVLINLDQTEEIVNFTAGEYLTGGIIGQLTLTKGIED